MQSVAQTRGTRNAASVGQLQRQAARVLLWLRPAGGQARSRRNAWSAMVADNQRRQSRMLIAREIGPLDPPASGSAAEAVQSR